MKIIVNKTRRPLQVKLARGRVLRLGPAKEGQITTQDAERESVKKQIEAGDVEIFDGSGQSGSQARGASAGRAESQGEHRRFSGAKSGDR